MIWKKKEKLLNNNNEKIHIKTYCHKDCNRKAKDNCKAFDIEPQSDASDRQTIV